MLCCLSFFVVFFFFSIGLSWLILFFINSRFFFFFFFWGTSFSSIHFNIPVRFCSLVISKLSGDHKVTLLPDSLYLAVT